MWRFVARCVVGVFVLAGLAGCQSPWAKNFQEDVRVRGRTFTPTEGVQVRVVEPERLERFYGEMRERNLNSAVAYEDLSADQRREIDDKFYEALQLRERSGEVTLAGQSVFWSSEVLDPHSGSLEKFAKGVGADYAVVAVKYGGQYQDVDYAPVTTSGQETAIVRRRGRATPYTYWTNSTSYVPVSVVRDRYLYTVFFLRRGGGVTSDK